MLVCKGFRFRVYPTTSQIERLGRWDDALRFLWNLALEQRRMGHARPRDERVYPTAFDQMKELTDLRAELPWLADVPRNVCAQLLIELDKAWQRCFLRLGQAPRFKRKGRNTLSFCEPHPNVWRLDGDVLRFPKLGNLRAVIHRPLEGRPKTCTLRRDGDQWFASVACEVDVVAPATRTEPVVALDRGIVNVVADSDGNVVESPHFFAAAMKRLAHAQRTVSRRKKGSKNRQKAERKVARVHRKVRRQREHFVHVLSARYAKSHGTVVVEKLNIRGMTKSAVGTVDEPGTNVAQKHGLNRGILDAAWGRLAICLGYKLAWTGGRLEEVDAAFSSQTCSRCGHCCKENRSLQAVFLCIACGHSEHADVNAAKVLKQRRANRSALPVEGSPTGTRRSRKQLRVFRRAPEASSPDVARPSSMLITNVQVTVT
jgi:putative transposase